MTEPRTYPHGVPSWVDTAAHDLDVARRFYSGIFDWTFQHAIPAEVPGSYLIATIDGQDVAAIGSAEPDEQAAWHTYIAVDDADATAETLAAAGGTVTIEPTDAGPGGRLAGIRSPRGADFRLWQARNRPGAQLVNAPGAWNFSDLQTSEPHLALEFYAEAFGWEVDDVGFASMIRRPGYGDYLASSVDPDIRERQAEVMAPPGFEDAIAWVGLLTEGHPDHWQVSFSVADRDASASIVESLGGTVESSDDYEWSKAATIRDPEGARFVLSEFTPPKG
jgi:predicted enzyme related to lactoylglutathione lyase